MISKKGPVCTCVKGCPIDHILTYALLLCCGRYHKDTSQCYHDRAPVNVITTGHQSIYIDRHDHVSTWLRQ